MTTAESLEDAYEYYQLTGGCTINVSPNNKTYIMAYYWVFTTYNLDIGWSITGERNLTAEEEAAGTEEKTTLEELWDEFQEFEYRYHVLGVAVVVLIILLFCCLWCVFTCGR